MPCGIGWAFMNLEIILNVVSHDQNNPLRPFHQVDHQLDDIGYPVLEKYLLAVSYELYLKAYTGEQALRTWADHGLQTKSPAVHHLPVPPDRRYSAAAAECPHSGRNRSSGTKLGSAARWNIPSHPDLGNGLPQFLIRCSDLVNFQTS